MIATHARAPTRRFISFGAMIKRVSDRHGIQAAQAYAQAIARHQAGINMAALRSAIASKNLANIEAVLRPSALAAGQRAALQGSLVATAGTAGAASAAVFRKHGLAMKFNATHPNVVLYARTRAAQLVVGVAKETKQVIAEVIAQGARLGLTHVEQARAIREVVGLPPNWANAPLAFADELRNGDRAALDRRLSSADQAEIAGRFYQDNVDQAFIDKMVQRYSASLVNRRALNIARTETLRASHHGLNESWKQARDQGLLPTTAKRFWIVTPDDRLSEEHATIPALNPQGRDLDEPFETTEGLHMYPPSRPNCRCSVGLAFPQPGESILDEEDVDEVVEEGEEPPTLPEEEAPTGQEPEDAGVDLTELSDEQILDLPSSAFPTMGDADTTLGRFATGGNPETGYTFLPERKRLHDAMSRSVFEGLEPVATTEQPTLELLGGPPASGKSEWLKRHPRTGSVIVDPDALKNMLPEMAEGIALGNTEIGTIVHDESKSVSTRIVHEALRGRYNVVIDAANDNDIEWLSARVAEYRAAGYRVTGTYLTADTEVAWARAVQRGKETGRNVPRGYFDEMHRNTSILLPQAMERNLFDELRLIDTNAADFQPVLVAEHVNGKTRIANERAWQRFLAKRYDGNELLDINVTVGQHTVSKVLGGPGAIAPEDLRNYLAAYGQEWKAAPLPAGIGKMPFKRCYANASTLVMNDPTLRYVEGVAYHADFPGIPFMHAWAVTPEGVVIDPTWINPASARYFGVAYKTDKYLKAAHKAGYYGVLGGTDTLAMRTVMTGGKTMRWTEEKVSGLLKFGPPKLITGETPAPEKGISKMLTKSGWKVSSKTEVAIEYARGEERLWVSGLSGKYSHINREGTVISRGPLDKLSEHLGLVAPKKRVLKIDRRLTQFAGSGSQADYTKVLEKRAYLLKDTPESAPLWKKMSPEMQTKLKDVEIKVMGEESVGAFGGRHYSGYFNRNGNQGTTGRDQIVIGVKDNLTSTRGLVAHETGHAVDLNAGPGAKYFPMEKRRFAYSEEDAFRKELQKDLTMSQRAEPIAASKTVGGDIESYMGYLKAAYPETDWYEEIFADIWAAAHGFHPRSKAFDPRMIEKAFPNAIAMMRADRLIPAKFLRPAGTVVPMSSLRKWDLERVFKWVEERSSAGEAWFNTSIRAQRHMDALRAAGYKVTMRVDQTSAAGTQWVLTYSRQIQGID